MSLGHEELRELLASYALGAADVDEAAAVERHLEAGCESCEEELRQWSGLVSRLPEAVPAVEPSELTSARVLAAAAPRREKRWGRALAASLLVGLALLGVLRMRHLGAEVDALEEARSAARQRLALAESELDQTRTELARLRLAAAVAGSPQTRSVRLAGLEGAPDASARTLVDPASRRAAFFAGGLGPPPEGSTYQLWLIVAGTPQSGGVFDVDEAGRATLIVEQVAPVETIDAWAVTIEPAGGVPQPTGEMVLLG